MNLERVSAEDLRFQIPDLRLTGQDNIRFEIWDLKSEILGTDPFQVSGAYLVLPALAR